MSVGMSQNRCRTTEVLRTDVHTTTFNFLFKNRSSVARRSSRVIPAWWMPIPAEESSIKIIVKGCVCIVRANRLTFQTMVVELGIETAIDYEQNTQNKDRYLPTRLRPR